MAKIACVATKIVCNKLHSQVSKRGRLHDVFHNQMHPKYEQLKHYIVKAKTNHLVVLQTLSTTFHFLSAYLILVGGGSLIVAL